MLIIYTPADGEPQEFVFKPDDLLSVEAEDIEEVGGSTWETFDEFGEKFMADNRKAYRAVLWIMLRRTNPKLKFSDLEGVKVGELRSTFDDDEQQQIRASIQADESISEDVRENLLMRLGDVPPLAEIPLPEAEAVGKDEPDAGPTASESPPPDSDPSPSN